MVMPSRAATLASASILAASSVAFAQVPAGLEFRVNTQTARTQFNPAIAPLPGGAFVVVWSDAPTGPGSAQIRGRRLAADGTPLGAELVASGAPGSAGFGHVTSNARGDFAVSWVSASPLFERAQRFAADGSMVGASLRLDTAGASISGGSGMDAAGNFVVAWYGPGPVLANGIVARRVSADGTLLGSPFQVNTTSADLEPPSVAMNAVGEFVVAWTGTSSGSRIRAQRFTSSGAPIGIEFFVSTAGGTQTGARAAANGVGDLVVVWEHYGADGDHLGIVGRRFSPSGAPIGGNFLVNSSTFGPQINPRVAVDPLGGFVVAWSGLNASFDHDVFAQRFSASGARRGAEFRVNTATAGSQNAWAVGMDEVGNFAVVWESPGADGFMDVFAKRFGGLLPAALQVDTGGNRILEPGETVDVRPSWRNVNGAAQTFAGGFGTFTGPAGLTYTATDPTGFYGAVADGATAACVDCYAVSVSNPPVRPAAHIDALAVESLVPDAQGQTKLWKVHVGRSFADVPPSSSFYRFVETLLHNQVTSGCSPELYCPSSGTTREQMAVFVLVGKEGAGYVPPPCGAVPVFADVPPGSPFCRWVEELARRGVAGGCGAGNYCPTLPVSREQMAVFVLRTADPAFTPPACAPPGMFADVPDTSGFCPWIEELARRGVVTGCGGGNYCPLAPVSREEMGVFITVTFGLALYGV